MLEFLFFMYYNETAKFYNYYKKIISKNAISNNLNEEKNIKICTEKALREMSGTNFCNLREELFEFQTFVY